MIANGIVITIWGLVFAAAAAKFIQDQIRLMAGFFSAVAALFLVIGTAFIGSKLLINPIKFGTELGVVSAILFVLLMLSWAIYKILKSQSQVRYIWIGMLGATYVSLFVSLWLILAGLSKHLT